MNDDPSSLPPRFVAWGRTSTPPPEFWTGRALVAESDDEDGEAPPPDLWQQVGDVQPWGTALLLLVWCTTFAITALAGALGEGRALYRFGAAATYGDPWREPWRWLATTALHSGPLHLILNGVTLAIFGPAVERIFARGSFWLVVVAGGLLSSVASLAWRLAREGGTPSISVGGSGALFALGGALLIGAWRLRRRLPTSRARALGGALILLLVQSLVGGFNRQGTDNIAHLAGLLTGAAMAFALPLEPRLQTLPRTVRVWRLAGFASAALLVIAVLWGWSSGI